MGNYPKTTEKGRRLAPVHSAFRARGLNLHLRAVCFYTHPGSLSGPELTAIGASWGPLREGRGKDRPLWALTHTTRPSPAGLWQHPTLRCALWLGLSPAAICGLNDRANAPQFSSPAQALCPTSFSNTHAGSGQAGKEGEGRSEN